MSIDVNISDLFFNTDLAATAMHNEHGVFTGYDPEALRAETQMFLAYLQRLNVAVPTEDELIEDFHSRQ